MTNFWINKGLSKWICVSSSTSGATPLSTEGFRLQLQPAGPGPGCQVWTLTDEGTVTCWPHPSPGFLAAFYLQSCLFLNSLSLKRPEKGWPYRWRLLSHVLTCVDSLAYPFVCLLTLILDSDSSLGNASSLVSDCGWILELHVTLHLLLPEILILAFWHGLPTWDSNTNSRLKRLPDSIYLFI